MSEGIDLEQAGRFLQTLDPEADSFTFQTFDDVKARKDKTLARILSGSLDQLAPQLQALNARGAGVFVTVNETDGTGRKGDNIVRVRAVWQEDDGQGKPLPIDPHIEVSTSPGKTHRYLLVDGLTFDEHAQTMARIVAEYGSDPDAVDLTRVLRVPGFFHNKNEPHMVRLVHAEQVQPYPRARVLSAFPATIPVKSPPAPSVGAATEYVDEKTIADLRSALNAIRSDKRSDWIRQGARLRGLGDVGRGLWLDWSSTSGKFDLADAASEWDTIGHDRTGYRAIFAEAATAPHCWVNPLKRLAPGPSGQGGELVEVQLGDIMQTMPAAPGFVIHPLVPRRVATLFGGHGGLGKSMLGLTLCAHVACGRPWGPTTVEHGQAVYVSLEDEAEIVRYRLRRIIEAYGLPAAAVFASLRVFDGTHVSAELAVEANVNGSLRLVETPMMGEVEQAVAGATLSMIDNASDSYGGGESNRLQVRAFMRRLAQIARSNNAGLVLLAHIDKDSAKNGSRGNSYSGSTAWHNSARSRLALLETEQGLELRQEKLNLGKKAEPINLHHIEHGVLMPRVGRALDASAGLLAASDADEVLRVLRLALEAGLTISTAASGPVTASHALERLPELGQVYRGKEGRRRVSAALLRLNRDGFIVPATYQKPNRHQGERWELAQTAPGNAP